MSPRCTCGMVSEEDMRCLNGLVMTAVPGADSVAASEDRPAVLLPMERWSERRAVKCGLCAVL